RPVHHATPTILDYHQSYQPQRKQCLLPPIFRHDFSTTSRSLLVTATSLHTCSSGRPEGTTAITPTWSPSWRWGRAATDSRSGRCTRTATSPITTWLDNDNNTR